MKPLWDDETPPWTGWRLLAHLVPADDDVVPQRSVLLSRGWAVTQGRDNGSAASSNNVNDDLIVTWFDEAGKRTRTVTVLRGGHGDEAQEVEDRLVVPVKGAWRSFGWGETTGHTTSAPVRCLLPRRKFCQGEARVDTTTWLRLYGGSIKQESERDMTHPKAYLEVIEGLGVQRRISVDQLARGADGKPLGGRYEPEGLQITEVDGQRVLLVGFSVGRLGNTTMNVYGRPLDGLV